MHRLFSFLAFSLLIVTGIAAHPGHASAQTVFMVQLGSFKSDEEAAKHWNDLSAKFPDLFKPLKYSPTEVMLPPDDFVYHRTQAGPVATREDADKICERVKSANEECYVVETAMFAAPDAQAASAPQSAPAVSDSRAGRAFDAEAEEAQIAAPPPQTAAISVPAPEAAAAEPDAAPAPQAEATPSPVFAPAAVPAATSLEPVPAPVTPVAEQSVPAPAAAPVAQAAPSHSFWPFGSSTPAPAAPAVPVPSAPAPSAMQRAASGAYAAPALQPAAAPYTVPADNAAGDGANVHVGEAIPVPLSDPRLTGTASPYGGGFRGSPGSYNRFMPYWAEIGYFSDQGTALGYWSVLRNRDPLIPNGLRLRIVQPFQQRALASKLSLRVGPFTSIDPVRRLCSFTKPEHLGCRGVRDLGGSVSYQPNASVTSPPVGVSQNPYAMRRAGIGMGGLGAMPMRPRSAASPFGGPTPPPGGAGTSSSAGNGNYWIQLGSFMAPQAAEDKWNELKAAHKATLGRAHEQVYTPVGGRGVYRLRVGPYTRDSDAMATCRELKRGGSLCVVVSGQ